MWSWATSLPARDPVFVITAETRTLPAPVTDPGVIRSWLNVNCARRSAPWLPWTYSPVYVEFRFSALRLKVPARNKRGRWRGRNRATGRGACGNLEVKTDGEQVALHREQGNLA